MRKHKQLSSHEKKKILIIMLSLSTCDLLPNQQSVRKKTKCNGDRISWINFRPKEYFHVILIGCTLCVALSYYKTRFETCSRSFLLISPFIYFVRTIWYGSTIHCTNIFLFPFMLAVKNAAVHLRKLRSENYSTPWISSKLQLTSLTTKL